MAVETTTRWKSQQDYDRSMPQSTLTLVMTGADLCLSIPDERTIANLARIALISALCALPCVGGCCSNDSLRE